MIHGSEISDRPNLEETDNLEDTYQKILFSFFQTEHVQTIYQCTWPGCDVRRELCDDIESHVREQHLR